MMCPILKEMALRRNTTVLCMSFLSLSSIDPDSITRSFLETPRTLRKLLPVLSSIESVLAEMVPESKNAALKIIKISNNQCF